MLTRRTLLKAFGVSLTAWHVTATDARGQGKKPREARSATLILAISGMT